MRFAPIATIIALGAAILAGALYLGGEPEKGAPTTIGHAEAAGEEGQAVAAEPEGLPPVESSVLTPVAPATRTEAPTVAAATGGAMNVRVTDGITGQVIKKYWVAAAGTMDMTSKPAPYLSNPKTGLTQLPAPIWQGLAKGAMKEFTVSAPMYAPLLVSLAAPGAADVDRTIEMTRSTAIVGVVRDGSSAPLAAARVTLEYLGPLGEFNAGQADAVPLPDSYDGPTLRRTNDAGRYSFGHLPAGVYRTRVQRDGTTHLSDPIFAQAGRWALGDHWLDEHVRLAVTLVQATGEPAVASRILMLAAPEGGLPAGVTPALPEDAEILVSRYTDEEGRATLGPLSLGQYTIYVQSDEGTTLPKELAIQEGSRSILELDLQLTSPKEPR